MARLVARVLLAAALLVAGVAHFTDTDEFLGQVPTFLPLREEIVLVSGAVELVLGVALLVLRGARLATLGLVVAVFFVAVFPGNVWQAVNGSASFGLDTDRGRVVRLLFQPLLVAWALWCTGAWSAILRRRRGPSTSRRPDGAYGAPMSRTPPGDPEIPGFDRRWLDDDTLLFVRDGVQRRVRRVGPPEQLASMVYEPGLARRRQGRFERGVASFLADQHTAWLLRELRVDVVLDVGANIGQFAKHTRRMGYKGRIVSFEPVPDLVEVLEAAAADDPDWHVMPFALGNEEGTATINWSPGTLSSLLPASDFGKHWNRSLDATTTREIRIRRLADLWDDVLAGLDSPRPFLKMDTQGYDVETFRGAGDRVAQLFGLQSEVAMVPIYDGMPRFLDQLALYESAGFETTGMFPVNRDRDTLRAIEFDLMMVGPAGLAERLG